MQNHLVEMIVIVRMLALNAVFAAYEMALASVSRARLLVLCEQKRRGAESARLMKNRLEASLAVVQLDITVAAAVAAATGGASVAVKIEGLSVWIRKQRRKKPAEVLITRAC